MKKCKWGLKMNTYTSHSTLCCHWCKIPLGNATQVTYLNGNLPICDLCLSKQVTPKFEDATKYCHRIIYRQRKNQRERKRRLMKEIEELLDKMLLCSEEHLQSGVNEPTKYAELVEDIMSLVASSSSKVYGKRSAENRKKKKENETNSVI